MPKNVFITHPLSQSWQANGGIALELSPKPLTITRLLLVLRTDISTTATPGTYDDPWDRIIQTLSLTGGSPSTTFFDFRSARVAYNALRFIKQMQARRPMPLGASLTNNKAAIGWLIHFGVAPRKLDPNTGTMVDNPFDLTCGVPPVAAGSLSLQGSFGSANACGTGWTINDSPMDVYCWGVQPVAGDPPESYQPRAFPVWSTAAPTPVATSAQAGTSYNLPAGDFLREMVIETHLGANAPRSDGVLTDFKLYDQLNSRDIWRADRLSGGVLALQAPFLDHGVSPGNAGTNFNGLDHEPGVYPFPFFEQTLTGHPLFGADMRNLATGDLQLQYGVLNATAAELWVFFSRFKANPSHPLSQAAVAIPASA